MSKRIGNVVIIEVEPDGKCEVCGVIAETRPYGPGGIRICYPCGMRDQEGTDRRMNQTLFGDKQDA